MAWNCKGLYRIVYKISIGVVKSENFQKKNGLPYSICSGGSRIFIRRGAPLRNGATNTNKPIFLRNTSCIRKPQVISGQGVAHPLSPSPRSAPDVCVLCSQCYYFTDLT